MKRTLRHEEARLWSVVTATVRPAAVVHKRDTPAEPEKPAERIVAAAHLPVEALRPKPRPHLAAPPEAIEPGRKRRIAREREPIAARLDLHGYDQDRARAALHAFVARAHEDGARAVLVITGKGARGDGVLRRHVPEWLAESPSRAAVAGISHAERHHGGEGALYVALKRKAR
jgi:DNA-nicking Smr family endonuclease